MMMDDYHNINDSALLSFEQLIPVVEMNEDQPINNVYLDQYVGANNDINSNYEISVKRLPFVSSTSTLNTQEYSICNDIKENYDIINERNFNHKEWFIIDSISQRLRAPRQNEFLFLLLEQSRYSTYLSWIDKSEGLFKIHDPERVAMLWSKVKSRKTSGIMNYDKFARAIRFYYKTGSMIKTHRKHTFRFKIPTNGKLLKSLSSNI